MMPVNWIAVLLAGLIPTIIGFVWYHPKVFGTAWMNASGMTPEKAQGANMMLIMGLGLFFSLLLAAALIPMVIHQVHIYSTLMSDPSLRDAKSKLGMYVADFMNQYGGNFRTFKHGVLHGVLGGLLVIFPVIAVNALYERKSWKYIFINVGFWTLCMGLMGGLISGWRP